MSTKTITASFVAAVCLFSGLAQADNDYMVERGDSLIKIGKLFGVPYKEIMKVNNLKTTVIHPDQILRIPAGGRTTDRDLAAMAHAAETKAEPASPVVATPVVEPAPEPEPVVVSRTNVPGYSDIAPPTVASVQPAYIPPVQGASKARPNTPQAPETYTVREGDTLWNISRKFGVEAVELRKINNIKLSNIQIGQVLTLPSKVSIAAAN